MARWLSAQVGADGRVVGTDIDPRFLEEIREPNFEAWKHDIAIDDLPTGEFDLVHTRWVLQHLADPEAAIRRMIAALRPGGWLLVEGMDFFPIHTAPSQLYIDLMVGLAGVIASSGGNDFGGRALPAIVAKQGLSNVQAEGDFAVLNAGSPMAEFFRLSALQVRDGIVRSGAVATAQFDAAIALLEGLLGLWPRWRCREGPKTALIGAAKLLGNSHPRAGRGLPVRRRAIIITRVALPTGRRIGSGRRPSVFSLQRSEQARPPITNRT